jgi:hypothetical protein
MNWIYFAKATAVEDLSSYKPETCNNGGDYAFYENLRFFKAEDGRIGVLRQHSTSAEFDYCELTGSFQITERNEFVNALHKDGNRFVVYSEEFVFEIEPHFEFVFDDHQSFLDGLNNLGFVHFDEDGQTTEGLLNIEYQV